MSIDSSIRNFLERDDLIKHASLEDAKRFRSASKEFSETTKEVYLQKINDENIPLKSFKGLDTVEKAIEFAKKIN